MAIPIPDAAAAIDAIAEGKEAVLASYLTMHRPPDPEVIRQIVVALADTATTSGFRLQFVRRQRGQPPADPFNQAWDDNEIFLEVTGVVAGLRAGPGARHGHIKRAIGMVAGGRGATPRSIRDAYERVNKRRS